MGTYNTLTATFICPRCGGSAETYAELFFGYRDQLSLHPGDRYPWRTDSTPENGGRRKGGNCDGEGYVECPLCRRDFFIVAHVRSDIIESLEHDPTKPGYIPDRESNAAEPSAAASAGFSCLRRGGQSLTTAGLGVGSRRVSSPKNNMKTAIHCLLCFILTLGSLAQGGLIASDSKKDPITGQWLYHAKYTATISSDGTTSYPNGLKGTWRYLETRDGERKYQIDWKGGLYIEMFGLSKDGNTLDGTNKQGKPIRAVRVNGN